LYISDSSYLLYTLYSIKSFKKLYKDIDIYVVSNNFAHLRDLGDNRHYLRNGINFYKCVSLYKEKISDKIKRKQKISQLKWAIPLLSFFHKYDRILYCDSDTIFRGNIDEFVSMDFEDHSIIAVDDTCSRNFDLNRYKIIRDYGYKLKQYINSGVMLFDTKKFNDEDSLNIINQCIKTYNSLQLNLYDQDMINLYFDIKCIYDYRYNYLSYFMGDKCKDIRIEHFLKKEPLFDMIMDDILNSYITN